MARLLLILLVKFDVATYYPYDFGQVIFFFLFLYFYILVIYLEWNPRVARMREEGQ